MNAKTRHEKVYGILRILIGPYIKHRFRYECPDIADDEKDACIIMANHNMELDPVLLGIAFRRHMYFVASEHLTRKGLASKILMYLFRPIIRTKGKIEVRTVSEILRTVRGGSNVCIFAEGNRSFNGRTGEILQSTGKLAQKSGAALITFRIEGGYFTQPRWSTTLRRGRMRGFVAGRYSPEELKGMSAGEINEIICRDLYEDAYETQKREHIPFKGKKLALGMESTLFACPQCGSIGTLKSDNEKIRCSCGYEAEYTEYGELKDCGGIFKTITEWDAWQREYLKSRVASAADGADDCCRSNEEKAALFGDDILLYEVNSCHKISKKYRGYMSAHMDGLKICGHMLKYRAILGMSVFSRNCMVINTDGEVKQFEVRGDLRFCALKYLYLYEILNENGRGRQ